MTVVDRAGRQRGQDLNRDAAEMRIERMELGAAVRPMEDALAMRRGGWRARRTFAAKFMCLPIWRRKRGREATVAEFAKSLDALPGANVYLIDVGVLDPQMRGLGRLKLSSDEWRRRGCCNLERS